MSPQGTLIGLSPHADMRQMKPRKRTSIKNGALAADMSILMKSKCVRINE
jgi:hypothetical protein